MTHLHIELLKLWYIFSFSLGVWTCFTLLFSKRGDSRVKTAVSIYIGFLLVVPANAYIALIMDGPIVWLSSVSQNLTWLYGPFLYFFSKYALRIPFALPVALLHVLPFLIVNIDRTIGPFLFHYNNLSLAFLFAQIVLYASLSMSVLIAKKNRVASLVINHRATTHYWLMLLNVSLLVFTLFDITVLSLFFFGNPPNFTVITALACIVSVYVSVIALFSIYHQDLADLNDIPTNREDVPEKTIPVRSVELSSEAAIELDEKLGVLVKEHKPHMDEDISLTKLASLLGVTRNQLSELFNVYKDTSFYDFMNDLRYQESLLLLSERNNTITISDIAYQSGFNNRNSFYKVFKLKTGLTPVEYRKANIMGVR